VRIGFAGGVKFPLSTVFIILTTGLLFGYWFASNQVAAVAMGMGGVDYPSRFFLLTVLRCTLVILVFFSVTNLVLTSLTRGLIKSIFVALGFLPLLGVFANIPLSEILYTILALQSFLVLIIWQKQDYKAFFANKFVDVLVLLALFSLHYFITLGANGTLAGEIPLATPILKSFVLAKQFNFSTLDFANWAGLMNASNTLNSPLLQLLTLIFDLPSVSVEAFHNVFYVTYFILVMLGSYGVYAFLKYAAKVNIVFAFFGGLLFSFSGTPFIDQILQGDAGIFISPAMVFPYAMLALALAFEKRSYALALASGIALGAQYFLLTPPPEVTLYSLLFFEIFTLGLYLFHKSLPRHLRRGLALTSLAAFFTLAAYSLLPIVVGSMPAFTNISDTLPLEFHFVDDFKLLYIFLPVSIILLLLQERLTPLYKSIILFTVFIAAWVKVLASPAVNFFLVNNLPHALHYDVSHKLGIILSLSVFLLAMIALDAMARSYVILINQVMRRRMKGQEVCSQA
jgi:hypothetical protein